MQAQLNQPSKWIVPVAPRPTSTVRLFCFPYAGAGASAYRSWSKLLPAHIEAFALQAPGRETRFVEPLIESFEDLVTQATAAIVPLAGEKPFAMFGHSLGAAVAYETARRLEREGLRPQKLIVSGRNCPGVASRRPHISHLSDAEFVQHMKSYKGTPDAVLENKDLIELLLPMIRADFALAEEYQPLKGALLDCPIIAIGSRQDEWLDAQTLAQWGDLTNSTYQSHWFEGDHFYLNKYTADLVSYISQQLANF